MTGDGEIQAIFGMVGGEFGYSEVHARYHPFKEFKTTWRRAARSIEFRISDYIAGAPASLKENYAKSLFGRVCNGRRVRYDNGMEDWLRSPEFRSRNRPLYLERSRNLALSEGGEFHSLARLRDNLVDLGLVEGNDEAFLTWTRRPNLKRVGYCNVLMGVVAVSSALDSAHIPSYVPEYVLYHELLHIDMGTDSLSPKHDRAFRGREREHPRCRDAEDWLRRIASRDR